MNFYFVNIPVLIVLAFPGPNEVEKLECKSTGISLNISWNPPTSGSVDIYQVQVLKIIQNRANMITTNHLDNTFNVEVSNTSVQSPSLSKFQTSISLVHIIDYEYSAVSHTPYNVTVKTLNSLRLGTISSTICFAEEGGMHSML